MRLRSALMGFGVCLAATPAFASTWTYDADHSNVGFSVKHAMISNVHGTFRAATGTLEMDDKDVTKSTLHMEIRVDSIDTRNEKRDGHLKSPDFFDIGKYPTMIFKSTKVEKARDHLKVTGDLTLHGVTKPVTLHVEGPSKAVKDPYGMTRAGASATAKLSRKDFGLKWSQALETGGLLVADDINIQIDAEFVKKSEGNPQAPTAADENK
jgi:polyisoprenoid-binding protein YceI